MGSSEVSSSTDFASLKYSDLQKIAKKVGIKANVGQKKLAAALTKYYTDETEEKQADITQVQQKTTDNEEQEIQKHTPIVKTLQNTLKRTPVKSPAIKARKSEPKGQGISDEKQTPVRTPVTNSRKQTEKHTPVNSSSVNLKPQTSKNTPVSSPAVKCKPELGKQTPVCSPAVKSVQQAAKQTPVRSPAVKSAKRTPVRSPVVKSAQQAAKQTPVLEKGGKGTVKNKTPTNKRLSGTGKRKASESKSGTPVSSPPTKKRRSTFEIPQNEASPAVQNQIAAGKESPQTKDMIGAMKPGMTNEEMKSSLMSAIDKKVQAKCLTESASKVTSSIPRFAAFLAKKKEGKPSTPGSSKKPITPGNKNWAKIHKKNFDKFDSIDVYLDKKKKRAEEITASVKKAKNILAEVQASVNKLKAHKTPTTENLVKKPRRSSDTQKVVPFKPTAINLSQTNFNFADMKSPKTQPRKSVKSVVAVSQKKVTATPNSAGIVAATPSTGALSKKPTALTSVQKPSATPFRFTATLNTTLNTTQSTKKQVFDLQASLAKPLTWVPHKGKLKPFGGHGEQKSPVKKPAIGQSIQKSRDTRRADAAQRRANKKMEKQMARRGIKV